MNESNYTSLKLSKLLAENGFFPNPMKIAWIDGGQEPFLAEALEQYFGMMVPAYDILNDLCVKYATQMFGEGWSNHSKNILFLLAGIAFDQKIVVATVDKTFTDVEDYIWEHCLFNPKNK